MNQLGVNYCGEFGETPAQACRLFADLGFDAVFTCSTEGNVENFAKEAHKAGIYYECVHAPFKGINNIWLDNEEGEQMLKSLLACVDDCHNADVPKMVVHLSSGVKPPRMNDLGFKRFDELVAHAVKQDVILAFENQRKLANIAYIFETYNDVEQVRFCWDTGHEQCFAGGREYMPLFGHKLVYTHIHDNFSQPGGDLHMIPFDGNIDYAKVVKHLKNANYTGSLTLEITPKVWEGYNGISRVDYYQKAYNAIVKLRTML